MPTWQTKLKKIGKSYFVANFEHYYPGANNHPSLRGRNLDHGPRRSYMMQIFEAQQECCALEACATANANRLNNNEFGMSGVEVVAEANRLLGEYCKKK